MAIVSVVIYRNHTSDDITHTNAMGGYDKFKTPSEYSWDTPQGKQFVEWNTARDGSGTSRAVGDTVPASGEAYYAIWEDASVEYLTNSNELKTVADAIREKGGTNAELEYPDGFVSAIAAISTGTDVSDTTAAAGDVLSGKYFYASDGTKTQGTIATKTASNLSASGKTVTVPAGYYASQYTKDVATGTATTPATTITANPSISVSNSGLITANNSKTQSVTPTVSAGYVSSGTAGTITVSGSNTSQLTVQAAQTITPTTTDQTIASGKYLTGAQTIKGDANLIAGNIKKDVSIFGVTGSYEGGSSATTVTFYDDGSETMLFSGNYITYIDGNGDYQHTTSLKQPSSDPESYQMLSGSLLTYVSSTDPEMAGIIGATFTGMTLVDTKTIKLSRQTIYLRYYQVD